MNEILLKAKENYDFYETQSHHSNFIYQYHNPKTKLKVIDICCGLGSLINPWYDAGHNITLVEINQDFIPILKKKYPKAKLITKDYLSVDDKEYYDVFICNPPFNDNNGKRIYPHFFCKILTQMNNTSSFYFISPKMFYTDQVSINLEIKLDTFGLKNYVEVYKKMPAYYYYDKYNHIELHSNKFKFNNMMIKRMVEKNIIDKDFIKEYDKNEFTIEPYFEFRFLKDISDFTTTKCKCGLFLVNR